MSRRRFVLERLVRQEKPLQRFIQTAIVIGTAAAGALSATAGAANAATPGELNLNPATDCPDLAQHWPGGPDECVQALQQDLHLMGAGLGEDGFFGPQMQRAVMRFPSGFRAEPHRVADLDTRHSPQEDMDAKQQTAGYDPMWATDLLRHRRRVRVLGKIGDVLGEKPSDRGSSQHPTSTPGETVRRVPVDSTKAKFISTGKSDARAKYAERADGSRQRIPDAQDQDDQGHPGWVTDWLVDDPDADRAEVAAVKVAAVKVNAYEVPEFRRGQKVEFVGLTAVPHVLQVQNRVSLSFAAEGFDPPGQRGRRQAACSTARLMRPDLNPSYHMRAVPRLRGGGADPRASAVSTPPDERPPPERVPSRHIPSRTAHPSAYPFSPSDNPPDARGFAVWTPR